jgi:hypothetical protein
MLCRAWRNLEAPFSQAWPQLQSSPNACQTAACVCRWLAPCMPRMMGQMLRQKMRQCVGEVVQLFSFAVVEGRSGSDWATHHTKRWCESEMRYSAALDPRVVDRVMPTSTKTAHHAHVQLEAIRPTSIRSITSCQQSASYMSCFLVHWRHCQRPNSVCLRRNSYC